MTTSSRNPPTTKSKKSKAKPTSKESTSPFRTLTTSLYVSLSPCSNNFPLEGLCAEHLSPHLLSYYAPFNGVLLAYSNPRISEHPAEGLQASTTSQAQVLARSIDEYAVTYVWLTAEFLVFRPEKGTLLEGFVNLQNESMLGLICYNYFNVAVPKEKLPEGWSWDGEAWNDGTEQVVGNRKVVCRVDDFEASGHENLSIHASLVEP